MADRGIDVAALRVAYEDAPFDEVGLAATPLAQFTAWLAEAVAAEVPEPNAMVLATATPGAHPSARCVLLKGVDARGFSFFTNLESRKSGELGANPSVALVFPWIAIRRQVVVTGAVELVPREEVDTYWLTRPLGSRLGAWASPQSRVVASRAELDARYADVIDRFGSDDVPTPPHWGGWLVRPSSVEFWQGRSSRLHDRLRFAAAGPGAALDDPAAWRVERLAP